MKVKAISKEYIIVKVGVKKNGIAYDPTHDDVKFTFTLTNVLTNATWYQGAWETVSGEHFAKCLIGPGGLVTLVAGNTYLVSVKITDDPEIPVRDVGTLQVT
jgi:hypothetical protein